MLILKGTHFSFPSFFRSARTVNWVYELSINSSYDLKSEDQLDWNKLIGVKQNYLDPMKNSVMLAWRWNVEKQVNELAWYWHTDYERHWSEVIAEVKLKEKFTLIMKTTNREVIFNLVTKNKSSQKILSYSNSIWYLINSWFGGNRTASQTINISFNKVI